MQLYDITIAPNTTRQLDAPGSYFYYYTGSAGGADSTITMRGLSSGLRIILKPGQAFRLPRGEQETSWVLTNFANTSNIIGTVIVGDGDITDNRVTGTVEVVDGEKNRTLSGSVGIIAFQVSAVVGQFSKSGLWNPAGSGKRAIVKKLRVSSSFAQDIYIGKITAALANIYTPSSTLFDSSSFLGSSKMTTENSATPISGVSAIIGVQANQSTEHEFIEPIIVRPGYGLVIQPTNSNSSLSGLFNFFEESDN